MSCKCIEEIDAKLAPDHCLNTTLVWWDDISKTAKLVGVPGEHALPCCPHCHSVLYQMEPASWFAGLDRYEAEGHPGYRAMWDWMRGRCFPNLEAATAAYERFQQGEPPRG